MSTAVQFTKPTELQPYLKLIRGLRQCSPQEQWEIQRRLARTDLFFLIWFICVRQDAEHDWIIQRCREVEAEPNERLDLWAREHYKSTIITFGQTIQDILSSHGDDPDPKWKGREVTIGIFSHTRPIAKGFLRQIKQELEGNILLKSLFPDVLYENPQKDAPKWSEDDGIIVRRTSNPKESTVEAHGLVDGMPTGKHFFILNYDDVVTEKSVTTPEMMKKTTSQLELSYNLGSRGGIRRFIGTRYHLFDTYATLKERGTVTVREHPATKDGQYPGEPVLLSPHEIADKRRDQGPYTFGCQMLLNPKSEQTEGFEKKWLRYWTTKPEGGNRYIIVDPANEKRKKSDYTAAAVIELREDRNYYVLDMVRDKLNLTERTDLVINWHKQYDPVAVGYEKYGKDSDIEHIEYVQNEKNYNFTITALGGPLAKNDRIKRLIPLFENARIWLPGDLWKVNWEDRRVDVINSFVYDEYLPFPVLSHDDMLDCLARILDDDLNAEFPKKSTPTVLNFPSEF